MSAPTDLAYKNALAVLARWIIEASFPAQGGSEPGCPPQPGQVHPEAGTANPLSGEQGASTCLYRQSPQTPAGPTPSALRAETITGNGRKNHGSGLSSSSRLVFFVLGHVKISAGIHYKTTQSNCK